MKIRSIDPKSGADYIRKARTEILTSSGGVPRAEAIAPVETALYLFAYRDDNPTDPVGMVEVAFHDQVYGSFDDVPYRHILDLRDFCSLSEACGIRTIYANPEHRLGQPTYFKLALAATHVFGKLGARFATASTDAGNAYLNRLYEKSGGVLHGTFTVPHVSRDVAVYLFDIQEIAGHRALQRVLSSVDIDMNEIHSIRNQQLFSLQEV